MSRPRAADDFAAIRARMEELRRERAQPPADPERKAPRPIPRVLSLDNPNLHPSIRKFMVLNGIRR